MNTQKTLGFTLVELIVVATILTILATVGFISYESYLVETRDSKRLAQMSNLRDGLRLFITKGALPIPTDSVDIQTDGKKFAYQGYAGKSVLEAISYSSNIFDPLDEQYYTYYLGSDRRSFQLLGYLEQDFEPDSYREVSLGNGKLLADNYISRFPKSFGKDLGIFILEDTQDPIQEVQKYKDLGYLDLATDSGSTLVGIVSDTQIIKGEARDMAGLVPFSTCLSLYRDKGFTSNGLYTINPYGTKPFLVYCDMDENSLGHGGGWTFTTFVSTGGGNLGLFTGEAGQYRADRSVTTLSYGLDTTSIPHDEIYMAVGQADITQQLLDDKDVFNITITDNKKPLFGIPYFGNTSYSARFGFTGDYVTSNYFYKRNPSQYYQVCIRKTSGADLGICLRETGNFSYPNSDGKIDANFYSPSYDASTSNGAGNVWYYVR